MRPPLSAADELVRDDPRLRNCLLDPDSEVGRPYRGWREGDFDVHLIDVGIAEASFHVYPDGTTAIVDCGDRDPQSRGPLGRPPRPDASRRPGEWVARYISRVVPGRETIDYLVATHFHTDHLGSVENNAGVTTGRGADYALTGLSQVGEFYRFGVALDRGYPEYSDVSEKYAGEVANFRRFLEDHERRLGLRREAFRVGTRNQLRLRCHPERYDFETRNVCGNGRIWSGVGDETLDLFAREGLGDSRSEFENALSLGIAYRYGAFRFYTGGDFMNATADSDFEGPLAASLGPHDVCKANHHASRNSMTASFVNAVCPRAWLVNVWQDRQLGEPAFDAMTDDSACGVPGVRLVCPTGWRARHAEYADGKPGVKYCARRSGHVVAKAYDGGARFKVYYLSSADESMRVEAVFGPFVSRFAEKSDEG